jgi:hypothetical protein
MPINQVDGYEIYYYPDSLGFHEENEFTHFEFGKNQS